MYKLFIVDDESETREGLRYYIDWDMFGIEVVGDADNGATAFDEILRLKPDIVMTDVCMPFVDGIELAKKIKEVNKDIRLIFISGYNDTDYLKSAFKVEAADYILKPIDLKELSNVINKVLESLEADEVVRTRLNSLSAKVIQSIPVLKERFFINFIRDGYDERYVKERTEFLGIDLPQDASYCVLVTSVDDRLKVFSDISQKDKESMSFSILNISEETISSAFQVCVFENMEGEYVSIVQCDNYDSLFKSLLLLKENLWKYMNIGVTIGVGHIICGVENIKSSYEKASRNAEQKFILGKNRIIAADSLDADGEPHPSFFPNFKRLADIACSGNEDLMIQTTSDIFSRLVSMKGIDIKYGCNICCQIALTLQMQLAELNIDHSQIGYNSIYSELSNLETINDMRLYIENYVKSLSRHILFKRNQRSSHIIKSVEEYVHTHYRDNISINDVASAVFLNKNYLCGLFSQETGMTINEYITKMRIEKAKKLLEDRNNKLNDICYYVGYTDPAYFSKVFKKTTGMAPSKYRESSVG